MPGSLLPQAFAVLLAAATAAVAQPQVPDAGRLLQQTRPPPGLPQRETPNIEIQEAPPAQAPQGPLIHVARLRITGATVFAMPPRGSRRRQRQT